MIVLGEKKDIWHSSKSVLQNACFMFGRFWTHPFKSKWKQKEPCQVILKSPCSFLLFLTWHNIVVFSSLNVLEGGNDYNCIQCLFFYFIFIHRVKIKRNSSQRVFGRLFSVGVAAVRTGPTGAAAARVWRATAAAEMGSTSTGPSALLWKERVRDASKRITYLCKWGANAKDKYFLRWVKHLYALWDMFKMDLHFFYFRIDKANTNIITVELSLWIIVRFVCVSIHSVKDGVPTGSLTKENPFIHTHTWSHKCWRDRRWNDRTPPTHTITLLQ